MELRLDLQEAWISESYAAKLVARRWRFWLKRIRARPRIMEADRDGNPMEMMGMISSICDGDREGARSRDSDEVRGARASDGRAAHAVVGRGGSEGTGTR